MNPSLTLDGGRGALQPRQRSGCAASRTRAFMEVRLLTRVLRGALSGSASGKWGWGCPARVPRAEAGGRGACCLPGSVPWGLAQRCHYQNRWKRGVGGALLFPQALPAPRVHGRGGRGVRRHEGFGRFRSCGPRRRVTHGPAPSSDHRLPGPRRCGDACCSRGSSHDGCAQGPVGVGASSGDLCGFGQRAPLCGPALGPSCSERLRRAGTGPTVATCPECRGLRPRPGSRGCGCWAGAAASVAGGCRGAASILLGSQ